MKVNSGLLFAASLLLGGALAVGQQSTSGMAVDDPELYFGVFSLNQAHQKQIADVKAAEAARAKDAESEDPRSASLHQAFRATPDARLPDSSFLPWGWSLSKKQPGVWRLV